MKPTTMTSREILVTARRKIENPINWCRGSFSNAGQAYCAVGAVRLSDPECNGWVLCESKVERFLRKTVRQLTNGENDHVGMYNDNHTHAEVLAMFDRAIELCNE
jgi:hypothetical protein